ncbi:uncharacterized protein [Amphiura filiformis]|uniref:uncharacterized protein isoform X2 n=1 Tax=Amphiura filiformis TaxID=82378 RepID=UPI003B217736
MDKYRLQWAGAPCGQHGSYTFYKAVKFFKNGRWRIVSLGEFFFLKFSETDPLCIGELQLLWEDRSADGLMLSSSRFYFLPESTPDGRKQNHGEDEVIAVEGKSIFKLEDLMDWVCTGVEWNRGSLAVCSKDVKGGPQCNNNNGQLDDFALNNSDDDSNGRVKILSFPGYCRYKTALKRLENHPDGWLNDALVRALGGFTVPHRGTKLMYCKDEFEHPTLAFHEKLCDHLAPNLKGRPRKKKFSEKEKLSLLVRRTSQDDSAIIPDANIEDIKVERVKTPKHKSKKRHKRNKHRRAENEESEVTGHVDAELGEDQTEERVKVKKGRKSMESHLLAFMKSRNTPITRVPNLGFKKINIGLFWKMGQKLGGYDVICKKRLWKKIYDRLGGSAESTSAATCTRRHYERLILPYERHLKGLGHLPLPRPYQRPRSKDGEDDAQYNGDAYSKEDEYDWENQMEEEKKMKMEEDEDDEATRTRKALKALKQKRKPKEKVKKLKDQLKEIRDKKAQMSLQPIASKDGLLQSGLNLPPSVTSTSNTKPNMPGVMADKAVLFPNLPPGLIPTTSLGGFRQITVTSEGGVPGSMGPVILTIPSPHHSHLMNPLPPGVIAANPITTGSVSSSGETKPMINGFSGVITRAPMLPTNTPAAATSQAPSISQNPVIMRASQAESRPSGHLPLPTAPHSKTINSKAINNINATIRPQTSPIPGSTITSRPSVIQHTQHARTPPYMHGNAVHPSDLILRNLSPRKAQADKPEGKNHQNGPDPIIVTPVNPYLPRFPGMPPMMMPGQLPFPHPALHEQPPMNAKRRRTESGKENLDGQSPSTASLPPHMSPFYPVSVPMPVPRLVQPPFKVFLSRMNRVT